jgi:asparagine synthase (glutamine-hydrolysing)
VPKCPPQLKLKGNIEKYVLKQAVRDIVPLQIIQRPKSGMMVPVKFWFRRQMRRYAKNVLSKKNLKRTGIFNPSFVQKLIDYDMREVYGFRYGLMLWMLITFMLWYEQMIES